MGKDSKIGWTHHTFNPWWGCEKVSAACTNCYAETLSNRYGKNLWGKDKARQIASEKTWKDPVKWNAEAVAKGVRRRVFCASMADVFEDREDLAVPRARLFRLIEKTREGLDWLLLTKRPENIPRLAGEAGWFNDQLWAAQTNVWVGTTVESQGVAELRLPHLLRIPAKVLFVSCEPLLEELNLRSVRATADGRWFFDALTGCVWKNRYPDEGIDQHVLTEKVMGGRLGWVIVGGESGKGNRRLAEEWVRSLRHQCADQTPFFYKQDAGFRPNTSPLLDGVRYAEVPT